MVTPAEADADDEPAVDESAGEADETGTDAPPDGPADGGLPGRYTRLSSLLAETRR